jgi:hypothetical protein
MEDKNTTINQAAGRNSRELEDGELEKVSGGSTPPTPDADPPTPDRTAAPNW